MLKRKWAGHMRAGVVGRKGPLEVKPPLGPGEGGWYQADPPQIGVRPFFLIPASPALGTCEPRKGTLHPSIS